MLKAQLFITLKRLGMNEIYGPKQEILADVTKRVLEKGFYLEINGLMKFDINFLREEICTKNIIIETLLENQKVSQTQNFNETLKLNTQMDNYIKRKNVIKNKDVKKQDNVIKINNCFEALKDDFKDN